jgi:hypothetical protein
MESFKIQLESKNNDSADVDIIKLLKGEKIEGVEIKVVGGKWAVIHCEVLENQPDIIGIPMRFYFNRIRISCFKSPSITMMKAVIIIPIQINEDKFFSPAPINNCSKSPFSNTTEITTEGTEFQENLSIVVSLLKDSPVIYEFFAYIHVVKDQEVDFKYAE